MTPDYLESPAPTLLEAFAADWFGLLGAEVES